VGEAQRGGVDVKLEKKQFDMSVPDRMSVHFLTGCNIWVEICQTLINFKIREICPKTITLSFCKLMDNHQTCSTAITSLKWKKSIASNDITN
jgi:hypothetical protein